ncbi:MAG: cyclodeaminase/cyclohydrolase family protein [Lachnospiraceae bacterium]|nr:cyclodeaminase/cyclohydrolase family protein [Lachnospiraceae bacterium]
MVKEQVLNQFLDALSSNAPSPGGGGASALAGAFGASLSLMVISLTLGKKAYADAEEELQKDQAELIRLKETFLMLADRDEEVFLPLMQAYAMPRSTSAERSIRQKVLNKALKEAASVPLEVMETASEALKVTLRVAKCGSKMAISDAGVAASYLRTALEGGALNVQINLQSMKDSEEKEALGAKTEELKKTGKRLAARIIRIVGERIGQK